MHKDYIDKVVAVYDIETPLITSEGITAIQKIYCISICLVVNGVAQEVKAYTEFWTPYSNGSLMEAVNVLHNADVLCAHNGNGFDDVVLQNIYKTNLKPTMLDTLTLTKLMYSKDVLFEIDASLQLPKELWGSYSLKSFGYRLGDNKIEFEEFDEGLTKELVVYCNQDVQLTTRLLLHLMNQDSWPLPAVIEIEHKAKIIIVSQEMMGFYLDIEKTRALNTKLLTEKLELATKLSAIFSPKFLRDGQVKTYKKLSKVKKYLPNNNYIPLIGTKD